LPSGEIRGLRRTDFRGLHVIEKNGVKKSLRKMQIFLDKILFCDRLCFVEKCAPIIRGVLLFRVTEQLPYPLWIRCNRKPEKSNQVRFLALFPYSP
jgi:hypothetical protein